MTNLKVFVRYSEHVPSPFLFEPEMSGQSCPCPSVSSMNYGIVWALYISKMRIDFGQFYQAVFKAYNMLHILIPNKSFRCPDDVSRSRTPYPEVFFQETWLMWSSLEQIWPLSWWEMILGSICSIDSHKFLTWYQLTIKGQFEVSHHQSKTTGFEKLPEKSIL